MSDLYDDSWKQYPCMNWSGSTNNVGYGQKTIKGKSHLIHRLEWQRFHGPVPKGFHVLHKCDNTSCFQIKHLFLGTPFQNMQDKTEKGRQSKLTTSTVLKAVEMSEIGFSRKAIARDLGLSYRHLSQIINGKCRSGVTGIQPNE